MPTVNIKSIMSAANNVITLIFFAVLFLITACGGSSNKDAQPVPDVIDPPPTINNATLSWTSPVENTDLSPITDLTGFKIYYGESANQLTNVIPVDSSNDDSYLIENLTVDVTYYFAVTALNSSGVESEMSDIVSKLIISQ